MDFSHHKIKEIVSLPLSRFRERIQRAVAEREAPAAIPHQGPTAQPEPQTCRPPCLLVFSDTENDTVTVDNTLRFAGILDKDGGLVEDLQGLTLIHTGDLLNKHQPSLPVVEYWQNLQRHITARGGALKLIVGNHELEIWQRLQHGRKPGIPSGQAALFESFIPRMDLFHVSGNLLFIHGYPTLRLLKTLLHYTQVTGKDLNSFNQDHYRKAFKSVKAIRQYAYMRKSQKQDFLLYDPDNLADYYKKRGRKISRVLEALNINTVIHGHRPQRSGVQADYEFGKWLPGIRMIGNDIGIRRGEIGAALFSDTDTAQPDIHFINRKSRSKKHRKRLLKALDASRPISDQVAANASF
jgi:hypothetical protein